MTTSDSDTGVSGRGGSLRVPEAIAALRSIPFGGFDDSTRDFDLPPAVRASVAPALTALRWGAVAFGIAFTAPDAFKGSYNAVIAVAVCLFITTWRTIIPIRLASERSQDRLAAASDVILIGMAVGLNGAVESPFIFSLMAAIAVVAFGWGYIAGAWAVGFAVVALALGLPFGDSNYSKQMNSQRDLAVVLTIVVVVVFAGFLRQRLLDAEGRRGKLALEIDSLNDANELLALVNSVARTLPSSLTLRDALDASRRQIEQTFGARVIALLAYDENSREWVPRLADGCVLNPAYRTNRLPQVIREALGSPQPILINFEDDGIEEPIQKGMKSGLYSRLVARSTTVGVLALEHPDENKFEHRHVNLMSNMAEVLALTIDNARWFGR
ncbi:MAG TPA: GAF domain-containing protein, partial [Microthrixaceae bacterium]|nr:GAF domain-containing protein [Microthrixaceae bacterium]